ncbi:hypothetical protein ACLOJK_016671 [Asimina triloba]
MARRGQSACYFKAFFENPETASKRIGSGPRRGNKLGPPSSLQSFMSAALCFHQLQLFPRRTLVFPLISALPTSLSFSSFSMEANQPSSLVLSGKSSTENDLALSLKNSGGLKLLDGQQLSVLLRSEIHSPGDDDRSTFQIDSYMDSLSANRFGRLLIWSPRLPSTHDLVSQNFCELPLGSVCVADIQFKGRGRSKNIWESPVGCLMFSFTLQMDNGSVVPLLQYVVSLAMTEAIKTLCEKNLYSEVEVYNMQSELPMFDVGLPHLDVKIKWPNDLYLNGLKVGGILCTSTYKSKKFNVSAGIGLNVDNEKPTTCLNATISKSTPANQLKREYILAEFFNKFEILFDMNVHARVGGIMIHKSDDPIRAPRDWRYHDVHNSMTISELREVGQRVIIEERNEGPSIENIVVTIQVNRLERPGLTPSGYLLALGEDNLHYELHPDGNRTVDLVSIMQWPICRISQWLRQSSSIMLGVLRIKLIRLGFLLLYDFPGPVATQKRILSPSPIKRLDSDWKLSEAFAYSFSTGIAWPTPGYGSGEVLPIQPTPVESKACRKVGFLNNNEVEISISQPGISILGMLIRRRASSFERFGLEKEGNLRPTGKFQVYYAGKESLLPFSFPVRKKPVTCIRLYEKVTHSNPSADRIACKQDDKSKSPSNR